jgi:hypothetical protein
VNQPGGSPRLEGSTDVIIHPQDPNPTLAGAASQPTASDQVATIDSSYRLLMIRGLSSAEASNVVAYVTGLHAAEQGWALHEIKGLLALRSFVTDGFIDS